MQYLDCEPGSMSLIAVAFRVLKSCGKRQYCMSNKNIWDCEHVSMSPMAVTFRV
jgi:hypothetical protein